MGGEPVLATASWRDRLRAPEPQVAGWSCALGCALGVLPIPGFQVAAGGLIAWRLGLHLPLVLAAINIGFGPLFLWWGLVAITCGGWLRSGQGPGTLWEEARTGWPDGFWSHAGPLLGDWLLGCLVLVPAVALMGGLLAFRIAERCRRRS